MQQTNKQERMEAELAALEKERAELDARGAQIKQQLAEAQVNATACEAKLQDHQKGAEQSEGLELALQSDGALPKPMLDVMLANFSKVMECFVKQVGPEHGEAVRREGAQSNPGRSSRSSGHWSNRSCHAGLRGG